MNARSSAGVSSALAAIIAVVLVLAVGGGVVYLYASSSASPKVETTTLISSTSLTTTTTALATSTVTSLGTSTLTSTVLPANAIVPLRVFAAASFGPALEALQSSYQLNNSISLIYNFASSGALETQIANGSPADVFLDADASNNIKLQTASLLGNGNTYQTLIYNHIALFVPANNPKNITQLSDLLRPGVRVAIGAPASVPAGAYTIQVWGNVQSLWGNSSNPDFKSAAYSNFTRNAMTHVVTQTTDVESAITAVLTGSADAAFGYASDGIANSAQLHEITIPPDVNVQAVYTASVTRSSSYPNQASAFVKFLTSTQGQAFLQKWGFTGLSTEVPPLNLTVVGASGSRVLMHASDIAALSSYTASGGLRTNAGAISNSSSYVGVPITSVLASVGGITQGQSVNVTGSDGDIVHYSYQQVMGKGYNTYDPKSGGTVNSTQPLTLMVAYSENGAPLGTSAQGGSGPLRTVIVGPQGFLTDGALWVKWVVSIQVLNSP